MPITKEQFLAGQPFLYTEVHSIPAMTQVFKYAPSLEDDYTDWIDVKDFNNIFLGFCFCEQVQEEGFRFYLSSVFGKGIRGFVNFKDCKPCPKP